MAPCTGSGECSYTVEQADIEKLKTKANLRKFKKMPTLLLPQAQMSSMQMSLPEPAQDKKEVGEEAKNQTSAAKKPKESSRVEPKKEEEKKAETVKQEKNEGGQTAEVENKKAGPKGGVGRDQDARLKAAREKRYREYRNLIEIKFLQRLQDDAKGVVFVNPKDQHALDKANENVDFGIDTDLDASADEGLYSLRKRIPRAAVAKKPRPRDIMWSAAQKRRLLPSSVLGQQGLQRARSGDFTTQEKESGRRRPKTAGRNTRASQEFADQVHPGSQLVRSAERIVIDADDLQSLEQSAETIEEDLSRSPRRKTADNGSDQEGFGAQPPDRVKTIPLGSRDNTRQST